MQPVARAASSDASSRMPPESSTLTSRRSDDVGEQLAVGALAERGVEVDEMDPLRAVGLPLQGGVERRSVRRLAAELALDEAHGLSIGDVDGGEEFEGHGGDRICRCVAVTLDGMKVILVPGFWLDASSWDASPLRLEAAGHDVTALTLPGLESVDADRSGIGLVTHIDAVVAADRPLDEPVVLVGHSGGGPGRPRRGRPASRPGGARRSTSTAGRCRTASTSTTACRTTTSRCPLPPWSVFREEGSATSTHRGQLDDFRARAIPLAVDAATDPLLLHDERRFDVPVTLITHDLHPRRASTKMSPTGEAYIAELSDQGRHDHRAAHQSLAPVHQARAAGPRILRDAI